VLLAIMVTELSFPVSAGSSCAQPVDGAGDPDRLWLQGKPISSVRVASRSVEDFYSLAYRLACERHLRATFFIFNYVKLGRIELIENGKWKMEN
jgi:hypothetical protein